ncbi:MULTISPECIES: HNH endonuclease [Citricoccus]|uniref:HNH endonuclease n=1 Tax=Citricoccus TaxID=169133 RepID=UPI000255DE15|nr:HNH endonuclease [Citricoccus sp. CH26A]
MNGKEKAMGGRIPDELMDWSLPDLLDAGRALVGELAGRLSDPMLMDHLPHFPSNDRLHPADEWGLYADVVEDISFEDAMAQTPVEVPPPRGTFPELHTSVEELGRVVDSARTALAGHTDRLFDEHASRKEILGIPEGKSAYRDAVDYLREHLRISRRHARSRIERSRHVLSTPNLDRTQAMPPRLPILSRAASEADLDPAAVDVIASTLAGARVESTDARVAPADVEKLLGEGERSLVSSARVLDPDALGKVCAHWRIRFDALVNPDGAEPTDGRRRTEQGLFYRGRRTGLHRWSLVATDGQHEVLKTLVSAASNTRAQSSAPSNPAGAASTPTGSIPTAASTPTGDSIPTAESASPARQACTTGPTNTSRAGKSASANSGADTAVDVEADLEATLDGDRGTGGVRDPDGMDGADVFSDPGILWAQQLRAAGKLEAQAETERAARYAAAAAGAAVGWNTPVSDPDDLDERTRNQQELDGMISALTGALALTAGTDAPDGGGGARPQVLVTIDYQTLLDRTVRPSSELPVRRSSSGSAPEACPEPCCDSSLEAEPRSGKSPESAGTSARDDGSGERGSRFSSASYAGEISPTTIRAWACDAELIPVVLGGEGEVLDLGRSRRLFTRTLRRAITARDGGCTAPGCTIPAPWCEAHHIEHWEHGGPTSVDNGVLLCSHHHHAVHAGGWTISMRHGVPWFIPAAYRDPCQRPRRNTYWRPETAAEGPLGIRP